MLVSKTNGSTKRSRRMRPSTTPATIAMISPDAIYSAAILKPNRPTSSTTATSLTSGEAIRNDSVTPSGTPAATKPMNAGTAEHEQNGVATPESRGGDVADALALARRAARGCARCS